VPAEIFNCSKCGRSHFANELQEVKAGSWTYILGPDCHRDLLMTLSKKELVGTMIKTTIPLDEWQRVRDERRMAYAGSAFRFGWAG